jgi:pyridoxal phosphate enzyme (YggS family)
MIDPAAVAEAVAAVRARIDTAAAARPASAAPVQLIAVTKGFGADAIIAACAAGCAAIGENYGQELQQKMGELQAVDTSLQPEVHFIGQLQTNKVRSIAALVDVWQTVDRPALVDEIAQRAPGARVFIQVNTTAESSKGGCEPAEAGALVRQCVQAGLRTEGLMTVGPTSADPTRTAQAFAELRTLADGLGLAGLSMGMSGDFELAIANGATHVRIGGALFGPRPNRRARIG